LKKEWIIADLNHLCPLIKILNSYILFRKFGLSVKEQRVDGYSVLYNIVRYTLVAGKAGSWKKKFKIKVSTIAFLSYYLKE
jgi:hypothetical protein